MHLPVKPYNPESGAWAQSDFTFRGKRSLRGEVVDVSGWTSAELNAMWRAGRVAWGKPPANLAERALERRTDPTITENGAPVVEDKPRPGAVGRRPKKGRVPAHA